MGQLLSLPSRPPHEATPLPEVDQMGPLADDKSSLPFETAGEVDAGTEEMREDVRSRHLAKDLSTSSAATRVFAVFELAEQILEDVRPQDLLLWQQVNKSFRDVFKNSTRLQALMYRPPTEAAQKYRMLAVLPDFVSDLSTNRKEQDWYWPFPRMAAGLAEISNIYEASSLADKTDYSWRHMVVCKPAVKHATMFVHDRCFNKIYQEDIKRDEGVTLGDFIDAAARYSFLFVQRNLLYRYRFTLNFK